MTQYRIERYDISWATVDADSPEEALEIANSNPDLWDFDAGTPEVFEE